MIDHDQLIQELPKAAAGGKAIFNSPKAEHTRKTIKDFFPSAAGPCKLIRRNLENWIHRSER